MWAGGLFAVSVVSSRKEAGKYKGKEIKMFPSHSFTVNGTLGWVHTKRSASKGYVVIAIQIKQKQIKRGYKSYSPNEITFTFAWCEWALIINQVRQALSSHAKQRNKQSSVIKDKSESDTTCISALLCKVPFTMVDNSSDNGLLQYQGVTNHSGGSYVNAYESCMWVCTAAIHEPYTWVPAATHSHHVW